MSMMQQTSIPEMVAQSRDIISNPSVITFERYEHRGTMVNAAIYVAIAAVISGLLGLTGGLSGLLGGALGALVGFFTFTGLVFYIGKSVAGGTGTWDEVAYTFSLFWAPLAILSAAISFIVFLFSWIPLLNVLIGLAGFVIGLAILLVNCYFAYIAVQSSMNIRDQGKALTTLGLAVVGTIIIQMVLLAIF
jgi:hypothetical protein